MIQLSEREQDEAFDIGSEFLKATAGKMRGIRLEVIAFLIANEVHDLAAMAKTVDGTDLDPVMIDMMDWITTRAMEMIGEAAMAGVEKTTPQ